MLIRRWLGRPHHLAWDLALLEPDGTISAAAPAAALNESVLAEVRRPEPSSIASPQAVEAFLRGWSGSNKRHATSTGSFAQCTAGKSAVPAKPSLYTGPFGTDRAVSTSAVRARASLPPRAVDSRSSCSGRPWTRRR